MKLVYVYHRDMYAEWKLYANIIDRNVLVGA